MAYNSHDSYEPYNTIDDVYHSPELINSNSYYSYNSNESPTNKISAKGFYGNIHYPTTYLPPLSEYTANTKYGISATRKRDHSRFAKDFVIPFRMKGFNRWAADQATYIAKTPRITFMLTSYTHRGDKFINAYLRGNLHLLHIKPLYDSIITSKESVPFSYQIYDQYDYLARNGFILPPKDDFIKGDILQLDIIRKYFEINYELFTQLSHLKRLLKAYAEELNDIIYKSPRYTHKMIVYRGITSELHIPERSIEYTINSFISTSIDPSAVYPFMGEIKKNIKCCIYEIRLPVGIPYIYMPSISKYGGEKEILLPPNIRVIASPRLYLKHIPDTSFKVYVRQLVATKIEPSRNILHIASSTKVTRKKKGKALHPTINNYHSKTARNKSAHNTSRKYGR